jgi:hypothetical protein
MFEEAGKWIDEAIDNVTSTVSGWFESEPKPEPDVAQLTALLNAMLEMQRALGAKDIDLPKS